MGPISRLKRPFGPENGILTPVGVSAGTRRAPGSIGYAYDARGNLIEESHLIEGLSFTTGYRYDGADNLIGITYPSGQRIDYLLDAAGRIAAIDRNAAGVITPLVGSITYEPFGPANGWSYGNGLTESRNFDLAGRLSEIRGALELSFGYDGAGNVISLGAPVTLPGADDRDVPVPPPPAVVKPMQGYAYDALNRLQQVQDHKGAWIRQWQYDPVGNRLNEQTPAVAARPDPGDGDEPFTPPGIAAGTETYGYAADSNRLIDIDGVPRIHDAVGNLTDDGVHQYTYDDRNRLVGVDAIASYQINGRGERVSKAVNGITTYFVYGQGGLLLGEYGSSGAPIKEYVYLQGAPVAVMTDDAEYFIHTDHLGTPREATDEFGSTVWRWSLRDNAFGDRPAEPVSYGDSDEEHQPLTLNLRFPGQYFDTETGLHYNYFRDYDPGIGRYIESDPIGLEGGVNTYHYALANPNLYIDATGGMASTAILPWLEQQFKWRDKRPKRPATGWQCNVKCNTFPIRCPDPGCGPVEGTGVGRNLSTAIKRAKKDAHRKQKDGCQAKHCSWVCINSKGDTSYSK